MKTTKLIAIALILGIASLGYAQSEGPTDQTPYTTPQSIVINLKKAMHNADLVRAMPKPAQWIEVRFEDFVLKEEETLARLEAYLGMDLARVPVRPEAVGRYKTDEIVNYFDFLDPAMIAFGYERPKTREI